MVTRKNPKSQKLCSPSAELIGGNDSLLDLIFPRLPVRSLTRFKSVSKQWCALISDAHFGRRHTVENPSSRIPSGLYLYRPVCYRDNTVHSISVDELGRKIPSCSDTVEIPDHAPIKLMRMARGSHFRHFGESCGHLYLAGVRDNTAKILNVYELNLVNMKWNIKHWVHIDRLISSFPQVNVNGGNQMCHSTQSILGVLRGERDEDSALIANVLVQDSETGQRVDTSVSVVGTGLEFARGEYCNGAFYWIRVNRLSCYRFDIDAEKLTQIALPPQARGSHFRHFGESCGHLYLAGVRDNTAKILNVYELNLVNMKWNIKHWVHIDRLISSFPQVNVNGGNQMCHSTQSILGVLRGERDEDSALIANVLGTVVSYNFKSKKVEVLLSELQWKDDIRSISAGPPFVPAYPLIASLHHL
ncbi:F-box protein At5g07610-like [Daucus carota subsp. sativus]|uniref:F-box protein At5g07610-like n=1 Tax=Daucus carota subsp. sativus TaxID=79200 RepID=UPI003082BA7E